MHRLLLASAAALALTAAALPAHARQSTPTAELSPAQRAAALAEIRAKVQTLYVFPEKRAAIVDRLKKSEKAGRYDLANPAAFAEALSKDLTEASGDKHMYLDFNPAQYAAQAGDGAEAQASAEAFWRAEALHKNHGLAEMKILPGNVRYLKITGFYWVNDVTGQAYDDAMRFLKGGDAVIIDVRGNGGGSGQAVNYLTSHFTKSDDLLLTFTRAQETPLQSRAQGFLPAGRLIGKPLYVLTDGGCFSACEEFVYHVQQFKLGELIGGGTGGGANNNDLIPIAPSFMVSISAGRPIHPVSGTNWEGVGIKPDTPSAPGQTLDVAMQHALTKLAAAPDAAPADREVAAWALAEIDARLNPPAVSPDHLRSLAGRYGEAEVTFRDGQLWYTRANRPERRLLPLDGKDTFTAEGATMLRVHIQGDTLEVRIPNVPPLVFKRG